MLLDPVSSYGRAWKTGLCLGRWNVGFLSALQDRWSSMLRFSAAQLWHLTLGCLIFHPLEECQDRVISRWRAVSQKEGTTIYKVLSEVSQHRYSRKLFFSTWLFSQTLMFLVSYVCVYLLSMILWNQCTREIVTADPGWPDFPPGCS